MEADRRIAILDVLTLSEADIETKVLNGESRQPLIEFSHRAPGVGELECYHAFNNAEVPMQKLQEVSSCRTLQNVRKADLSRWMEFLLGIIANL